MGMHIRMPMECLMVACLWDAAIDKPLAALQDAVQLLHGALCMVKGSQTRAI